MNTDLRSISLRSISPAHEEQLCPVCHGDCYVETDRGERPCPHCKATGIVLVTTERSR